MTSTNPCRIVDRSSQRSVVQCSSFPGRPFDPTANHSRPRRLYDKDVLRVGVWEVGDRQLWDVTPEMLVRIRENWHRARRRGVHMPVVWNHSEDARDQIGLITKVYIVGSTLRVRFWAADPVDIGKLGSIVNEVSVQIYEPWSDGLGNEYDIMMTHVGVVNHPVVPNQQPFRSLHLVQGASAMPDVASATATANDADPNLGFDIDRLIELVNELLAAAGATGNLAADTTLDDLVSRLADLVDGLANEDDSESPALDDPNASPAELQVALRKAQRRLHLERQRLRDHRQQLFVGALDRLIREGRVVPGRRAALIEAGRSSSFNPSLLAPLEDVPAGSVLPMRRIARLDATSEPPRFEGHSPMTEHRAKKIAKSFRP